MPSNSVHYPACCFIRLLVKEQLWADVMQQPTYVVIIRADSSHIDLILEPGDKLDIVEDDLLETLFCTTLTPEASPRLYLDAGSPQAVNQIEGEIVGQLVEDYRRIVRNQKRTLVQQLNRLL
ncbi:MAG: hypothetical protein AAGA83_20870 [Cyanobacteria bacterium P01_F01_bin.116]